MMQKLRSCQIRYFRLASPTLTLAYTLDWSRQECELKTLRMMNTRSCSYCTTETWSRLQATYSMAWFSMSHVGCEFKMRSTAVTACTSGRRICHHNLMTHTHTHRRVVFHQTGLIQQLVRDPSVCVGKRTTKKTWEACTYSRLSTPE